MSVGVRPKSVHNPTDMSRELRTVTTAARAKPHFDFTMSIFPEGEKAKPPEPSDESKTQEQSRGGRTHAFASQTTGKAEKVPSTD